ncbi:MAG: hypothetical protein HOG25_09760 [Gammaproteobacteria bacterium]|jgi:DNA-directed RNA polymerase subunit RPC12/RpoP|nr:hypothetical protein [Gammaproteobacteria bacterium]
MSKCSTCNTDLVVGENWTEYKKVNYAYECRECYNWRMVSRRYGNISQRDYNAILKSQGGGCAICGNEHIEGEQRFAIDHDHAKEPEMDIRGILCHNCNHALGKFKDNTMLLQNAIHYLKCDYHKIERSA